jgi:hypothetical protein
MPPASAKGVSGPGNMPVVAAVAVPAARKMPQDKKSNMMVIFSFLYPPIQLNLDYHQLLFLRAKPINPTRPEPRSRIEPGMGTVTL